MNQLNSMIEVNKLSHLRSDHIAWSDLAKLNFQPLLKAYANLISSLPQAEGNTADEYTRVDIIPAVSWERFVFPKPITDALIQLGNAIKDNSKEIYNAGKEEGKRALVMLSSGEMTLEQFDKK